MPTSAASSSPAAMPVPATPSSSPPTSVPPTRFDRAILSFARAYADKTEHDWKTLLKSKDLRDAQKALDADPKKAPAKKS